MIIVKWNSLQSIQDADKVKHLFYLDSQYLYNVHYIRK